MDVALPVDYRDPEVDIGTWDTVRDEVRRAPSVRLRSSSLLF